MMLGGLIAAVIGIWFWPLLILGIMDLIAGFVIWITSFFIGGKVTEHPVRLGIARQRIVMIQEDANPNAPFSCRLALKSSPTLIAGQQTGTQTFTEESWFSIEGPLLDGTMLSDEIKQLTRTRSRVNPRGKRKSKTR